MPSELSPFQLKVLRRLKDCNDVGPGPTDGVADIIAYAIYCPERDGSPNTFEPNAAQRGAVLKAIVALIDYGYVRRPKNSATQEPTLTRSGKAYVRRNT